MNTREFALWAVGKLEGKEKKGLNPAEVEAIQKQLAKVLHKAATNGKCANLSKDMSPEKLGKGVSFTELGRALVACGPTMQED
jgi:hypothetical protein